MIHKEEDNEEDNEREEDEEEEKLEAIEGKNVNDTSGLRYIIMVRIAQVL